MTTAAKQFMLTHAVV